MSPEKYNNHPEIIRVDMQAADSLLKYSVRMRRDLNRNLNIQAAVKEFSTEGADNLIREAHKKEKEEGNRVVDTYEKIAAGLSKGHDIVIVPGEDQVNYKETRNTLYVVTDDPVGITLGYTQTHILFDGLFPSSLSLNPHATFGRQEENERTHDNASTALLHGRPVIVTFQK